MAMLLTEIHSKNRRKHSTLRFGLVCSLDYSWNPKLPFIQDSNIWLGFARESKIPTKGKFPTSIPRFNGVKAKWISGNPFLFFIFDETNPLFNK